MTKNIKVSFCIPTFNRAVFLNQLIGSIIKVCNGRNDVEICISDNCSTDNTGQIIKKWQRETNIPIILSVNDENLGPDRNYLAAVGLASGQYSWLLGSDDVLCDFDFDEYLMKIQEYGNPEIILSNRVECDYNLKRLDNSRQKKWLSCISDKLFDFSNRKLLSEYFAKCNSLGGVFSYLSSIIVKTDAWKSVEFDKSFIGTAYSHVFILLSILPKSRLLYLNEALVLCRGENDTFSKDGAVKRYMIDYDGYFKLARAMQDYELLTPEERNNLVNILIREHKSLKIILYMATYSSNTDWCKYLNYMTRLGYPKKLLNILRQSRRLISILNKIRKRVR